MINDGQGRKDDGDKVRLELVPPELLDGIGRVLTHGAERYGGRNWERGMDWSRVFGALQRHLWAFWAGEDNDPDSGMPHTWHAGCCIAFLTTYEARGHGNDDRPAGGTTRTTDELTYDRQQEQVGQLAAIRDRDRAHDTGVEQS